MSKHFSLLLTIALFLVCLFASAAHADSVVLTGGTASTLEGVGTVNLLSSNFSLRYVGEIPPGATTTIGINSATQSLGLANTSFNGVVSNFFAGSLAFDNSLLTGSIRAYTTLDDMFFDRSPLFTVDFSGNGFLTVTQIGGLATQNRFTVATPEPSTLLLLGTSLASAVAWGRRRQKKVTSPGKK